MSDRTTLPRPVIGLVGSQYAVPRRWGELPVNGAPTSYVDAVLAAGGTPIVLVGRCAAESLDTVDALVLIGGGDVDPALYGGDPAYSQDVDPARDKSEVELVLAAAAARIPLLGVCRGLQVMVVAYGGTLTSDLGMAHIRPTSGHPVNTIPESLLARLLGIRSDVTSIHHQAVADPGAHWKVTAIADDGVSEAIEWTGRSWSALGVQWHPELDDPTGPALFTWLVEQGRVRLRRSGSSRPKRHRY